MLFRSPGEGNEEEGDEDARLVFEAMAYQVAKSIGSLAIVDDGKLDAIILTGGMSYSNLLVDMVKKKVGFLAPVEVYPGEFEMKALAAGGYRVMMGEEKAKNLKRC